MSAIGWLLTLPPWMLKALGLTLGAAFVCVLLELAFPGLAKQALKSSPAAMVALLNRVKGGHGKQALKSGAQKKGQVKPYLIETVIICQGYNAHTSHRKDTLNFTFKHDSKTYEVRDGSIFEKNKSIFDHLVFRIQGITSAYLALYWEGEPKAVKMDKSQVNPQVLARVRTSRVLGRALKEMFKSSILDNKGLVFFIIAFGVIAILILRAQGYI